MEYLFGVNFFHTVDNGITLKGRGGEGNFSNMTENDNPSRKGQMAGCLTDTFTCLHKRSLAPIVMHNLFCFYKVSCMAFRINS